MPSPEAPWYHDIDEWSRRLGEVTKTRRGIRGLCPAHDDSTPSLDVDTLADGTVAWKCRAGCEQMDVVAALESEGIAQPKVHRSRAKHTPKRPLTVIAKFPCYSTAGDLAAFQVKTNDPSRKYRWSDRISERGVKPEHLHGGLATVPLDEVVAVVEGHGPAKALNDAGIPAVCTVTGKGPAGWDMTGAAFLYGHKVVLIPDVGGEAHMDKTGAVLTTVAESICIVDWPGDMAQNEDAAQYIERHGADAMADLIAKARPWKPSGILDAGKDVLDLLDANYPPLRFVIPGILPEGTAILASAPKIGKSAFVYQVTVELALGGSALGEKLDKRPSLYYALEDGERRSQSRAAVALAGRRPARGMFTLRWSAPKLGEGLENEITAWLDSHENGVVWIDTMEKVRPHADARRSAYSIDVEFLTILQDIVKVRPGSTVVVILHLRKAGDNDFLARVSGTFGLTGSVDTSVVVERPRGQPSGTFHATGRDVGEQDIAVTFDGSQWERDEERIPGISAERQQVYDVIAEKGPIWPTEIAKEIVSRGGESSRSSAFNLTKALEGDGWTRWTQRGYESTQPKVTRIHSPSAGNNPMDAMDGEFTHPSRPISAENEQEPLHPSHPLDPSHPRHPSHPSLTPQQRRDLRRAKKEQE